MRKLFSKLAPKSGVAKREQADVSTNEGPANAGSATTLAYDVTEKDLPRLHQAAWSGNLNKAKQYTKDDPNALDNGGRTPLHLACAKGHLAVVKVLLQRNASPNVQDRDGRTPLIKAVQGPHGSCIDFLLQYGCNTNLFDSRGCTALHYAAASGTAAAAVALLEKGSNINHQNKAGQTPLHLACEQQQFATCQVLLERGADVNVADQQTQTPLMVAATVGASNIVTLLKKYGADVNFKDNQGRSGDHTGTARSEASTPQRPAVAELQVPVQPSTSRRSEHDEDASSSPELAVYASLRPVATAKSTPAAGSKQSQSNVGGSLPKGTVQLDDANSSKASFASAKQPGDDSEENSWCSSEEEAKLKPQKTQPKKVNLVKMLETFGSEGKAVKVSNQLAVDADSSAWTDSDAEVPTKQPKVKGATIAETALQSTAAAAGGSAIGSSDGSEEESSWDSDTLSKGPSHAQKKDARKQQQRPAEAGPAGSVPLATEAIKEKAMATAAMPVPSAPPVTTSDNEDGGWDSDTTSKQVSPRGLVQENATRLDPNHDAKALHSDWDSDGEAMSARTPRLLQVSGTSDKLPKSSSTNPSKPPGSPVVVASLVQESPVPLIKTDDPKEKELVALRSQTVNSSPKIGSEQPASVSEHQKIAAAAPKISSVGCRCSELTAELLESKNALTAALAEKGTLVKQLQDAQEANRNSLESLSKVMKEKETLTISNQELESRLQMTMQQLRKEEGEQAAARAALGKLQDELTAIARQHAQDLAVERQSAQQQQAESLRELSKLKTQMLQLENENQARPAMLAKDLEESHLKLRQQNSDFAAQLSEANTTIELLRSAVASLEAQNIDSTAKINSLSRDLGATKSERQQLVAQNKEQQDSQTRKIVELQDQIASSAVETKKQQDVLTEAKLSSDVKMKALLEEVEQSTRQLQSEKAARSLLESSVAALQAQLSNAGSEVHLLSEAQKNMERKHAQDLLSLQQAINNKEQEFQELQNAYEELRQRHGTISNDLHQAQEKVLAQASAQAERSSVIVQLRATLLEQTQAIESMEHEAAYDKKRLASMQAQMELLQDQLQRLKHRKLVSSSQNAIDGLLGVDSELKPKAGSQVRSPAKVARLKELLANTERTLALRDREIDDLHEQVSDVSTAKEELALQARELESQIRCLESELTVERRGNEVLRAQLMACMEQSRQMQSVLHNFSGSNKLTVGNKESSDGEVLVNAYSMDQMNEEKAAARSAAALERKLLRESKRCAELTQINNEMKTKLKLVKLYLREMAVHHTLLQGDRAAALAADEGRRHTEILNQSFTHATSSFK